MCELQVTIHTQILPSCMEAHHNYSVVYFSLINGLNKEWGVGFLRQRILRKSVWQKADAAVLKRHRSCTALRGSQGLAATAFGCLRMRS